MNAGGNSKISHPYGEDDATNEVLPTDRRIDRAKYDAIHRSLLAGLLGNIGQKWGPHEYTGARGRKFHLFPGSGLFNRKPPWVMAGEIVETTRLYARTVARIDPAWVERVAQHLVQRHYSEPHWNRRSAHVMASETVTLYGLVIVPRRRVHYGSIDPKASREIFIREALVLGEYDTQAPWFRHNRQLVRDVELIEAKLRRRDILVDSQSRYDFYDARLPAGIYDGPLFEKWRRHAEQKNRHALFMDKSDLMLPLPALGTEVPSSRELPAGQFPDVVVVNEIRLPLRYHFDPGHQSDGVTVTVALGLLNQVPAEAFEWLIPGWLHEKVIALIRTLPKELRVHFVPAPDSARYAVTHMQFGQGSLPHAISWQLGRLTGIQVPPSAFRCDLLPDWLRMNFSIIDEAGKPIAMGRDLGELRGKLKIELKETFQNLADPQWHRDDINRWDFGDLPEQIEVRRPGITMKGFPALVDRGGSVSLRLLESAEAAGAAMRGGLRRLFMLQLAQEIENLRRYLPGIEAMSLNYAAIRPGEELKRDLITVIADRALFDDDGAGQIIRTRDEFAARAEAGWRRLQVASREVCALVAPILESNLALSRQLAMTYPPLLAASVSDMREQLDHLLSRGFVAATPYIWLRQFPRFLKGIEIRLRKLTNAGAARDLQAMAEIRPLWEAYLRRAEVKRLTPAKPQVVRPGSQQAVRLHSQQAAHAIDDAALVHLRWLVEELRVSLFAQELKTSVPVSVKRVQAQLAEVH